MTTADVLERAIAMKKERGHVKGRYKTHDGICMYGALAIGAGASKNASAAELGGYKRPLMVDAAEAMGLTLYGICGFNNAHSKEECIQKMEEGLARLRTPVTA